MLQFDHKWDGSTTDANLKDCQSFELYENEWKPVVLPYNKQKTWKYVKHMVWKMVHCDVYSVN